MRPKAKGYYKDKSYIVQIGAAMIDKNGKLAKIIVHVMPEVAEDPNRPFVWDAGVDKNDVYANGVTFTEALYKIKEWASDGKKDIPQYAFFAKMNADIFLHALECKR
jgi:hypothetical protein